MDTEKLIESAKNVIGENERDDYIIAPTQHVELFKTKAPVLAEILKKLDIQETARQFEKWDARANLLQKEFKGNAKWSRQFVFWAAVCSAALLAISILFPDVPDNLKELGTGRLLTIIFTLAGMIFGTLGSIWLTIIRSGGLLKKWMQNRAEAEMQRLQFFKLITSKEVKQQDDSSIPPALFQLEYFRRFQLDVQLAYYENRSKDHDKAAQKALLQGAVAMGLVALANGAAGFLGGIGYIKFTAIASLGVVAKSFAAKVTNSEAINQDSRNAERYLRAETILSELRARLDAVREHVLNGKLEVLHEFVEAVHEQLSLEHRQWLESISKAGTAVGKLEKHLEDLKK